MEKFLIILSDYAIFIILLALVVMALMIVYRRFERVMRQIDQTKDQKTKLEAVKEEREFSLNLFKAILIVTAAIAGGYQAYKVLENTELGNEISQFKTAVELLGYPQEKPEAVAAHILGIHILTRWADQGGLGQELSFSDTHLKLKHDQVSQIFAELINKWARTDERRINELYPLKEIGDEKQIKVIDGKCLPPIRRHKIYGYKPIKADVQAALHFIKRRKGKASLKFEFVEIPYADFSNGSLHNVTFAYSDLGSSNFNGTEMHNVLFTCSNLSVHPGRC